MNHKSRFLSYSLGGVILALILFTPFPLQSSGPLQTHSIHDRHPLGPSSAIYEDKNKTLTIDQITHPSLSELFTPTNAETLNFGYSDSAYWIKFILQHDLKSSKDYYLLLEYPAIKEAEMYIYPPHTSNYIFKKIESLQQFHSREVRDRGIRLQVATFESRGIQILFKNIV